MKIKFDLRLIKKKFSIRTLITVAINVLVIVLLFLGIRKIFLPMEEKPKLVLEEKEKISLPGKEVSEKKVKKVEEIPLPFMPKIEEEVPIKVYKLSKMDFTDELPTVGTVKSIPAIELKFEMNGVIKSINFKEGDKVKKGDILASLDPKDINLEIQWAQAKLNSAEAEYKAALKRYEVIRKLYEVGAIIKDRLDQAEAEVDVAKSRIDISKKELALTQQKLEKLNLKAAHDGIIGKKEKEVGEFITPNDVVLTLLDLDNIFVEVGVIERDAFKVKTGQRVKVRVDTYPTRIFFGYIENVFPEIDERTRTVNIRIRVLDPGKLMKPGMFARADLAVYSKKDALVIPSTSVSVREGAYYAQVVEDNKVVYRSVSVDYITTDFAVISKGLREGELVIIETPGMRRLTPGTGIKIIETQEKLI